VLDYHRLEQIAQGVYQVSPPAEMCAKSSFDFG